MPGATTVLLWPRQCQCTMSRGFEALAQARGDGGAAGADGRDGAAPRGVAAAGAEVPGGPAPRGPGGPAEAGARGDGPLLKNRKSLKNRFEST